ncbi:hypothetical protein QUB08_22490 [Microcoleus sp. BR0-C5]
MTNTNESNPEDTSWHAATDPEKCLEMERKYGSCCELRESEEIF